MIFIIYYFIIEKIIELRSPSPFHHREREIKKIIFDFRLNEKCLLILFTFIEEFSSLFLILLVGCGWFWRSDRLSQFGGFFELNWIWTIVDCILIRIEWINYSRFLTKFSIYSKPVLSIYDLVKFLTSAFQNFWKLRKIISRLSKYHENFNSQNY